jgi:hypothetical protein
MGIETAIAVGGLAMSAAGTVGGLVGGSKAAGAASDAADAQTRLAAEQAALAREQWDRYLKVFAPYEEKLLAEAATPTRESPGYLAQMGTINRQYADTGANLRRMMGGRYESGGGIEAAIQSGLERNRVRDVAKAQNAHENERWNKMMGIAGFGRNLPATATAGYQGAGSQYGSLANMYGNLSGQAFGGVGQGIGNLMQMYALSRPQVRSTTPSTGASWLGNAMYETPGYGYWD